MRCKSSFCGRLQHLLFCGAVVVSLAQAGAGADEPKPDDPSAKQILDRMAEVYADCKSYRDSGMVKTLFIKAGGKETIEKPFTTAFVRPDRFRFEFEQTGNPQSRYIVWSKGKDVQTWWDVKPGIKKTESLELALAGATGVSGSSAHTIPSLLLPKEVGGRRLTNVTDLKRGEDGKLEKIECFRIEGKYGDHPITLWIEKESFLVRQIDKQVKFDNFRTEQTTTYDPTIDKEITDKMLEFDPPAQK